MEEKTKTEEIISEEVKDVVEEVIENPKKKSNRKKSKKSDKVEDKGIQNENVDSLMEEKAEEKLETEDATDESKKVTTDLVKLEESPVEEVSEEKESLETGSADDRYPDNDSADEIPADESDVPETVKNEEIPDNDSKEAVADIEDTESEESITENLSSSNETAITDEGTPEVENEVESDSTSLSEDAENKADDDKKLETVVNAEKKPGIFAEFKDAPYVTKKAFAVFLAGAIVLSTLLGAGLASLIHHLNNPEHYFEDSESYLIEDMEPYDEYAERGFGDEFIPEEDVFGGYIAEEGFPTIGIYIEDTVTENGNWVSIVDVNGKKAAEAGLQSGDIVLSFNGENVHSAYDLTMRVRNSRHGERVNLSVMRNGQVIEIATTLE